MIDHGMGIDDPRRQFDLTGRVALITGGSRGLGAETARGFAAAGADVIIVSRKLDGCRQVAEQIEAETGRRALPYACHMGNWDEMDGLVAAAYDTFGRIDVLVNNAGMSPLYDDLADVTEALWRKVIDVNLSGPFRLSTLIASRMKAAGGGAIINVSSAGALQPAPGALPYAAAKAGLNALTEGLARAYGPEVRVNAVLPGTFLTDVSQAWDMEAFERQAQGFALRRGGRPDEIVGTMLYLASAASSYVTGSLIPVDGGYLLPPEVARP